MNDYQPDYDSTNLPHLLYDRCTRVFRTADEDETYFQFYTNFLASYGFLMIKLVHSYCLCHNTNKACNTVGKLENNIIWVIDCINLGAAKRTS